LHGGTRASAIERGQTEDLAERARLALREAGDRASALNAFEAAARSYASALELWPDDAERPKLLLSYGTVLAIGREAGTCDLEESIEIADELGSPESLRGYNNIFSNQVSIGNLREAAAAVRAGVPVAERFGNTGTNARWLRFERVHVAYWEGRWDEALTLIEETLSELGFEHGLSRFALEMRGRIRI